MRYKVAHRNGLMFLSTGESFRFGEYVTADGLPPGLAEVLVAEGALVEIEDVVWDASVAAELLASKHGIDLAEVKGSGQGGRIIKKDVEKLGRGLAK